MAGLGWLDNLSFSREGRPLPEVLRFRFKLIPLIAALLGAVARNAAAEPAAAEKVVAYVGGALIDGTGGPLKSGMVIVTRDERIEAVVAAEGFSPPSGAEIVNVKNRFILPGLINSHEHLATPPHRKFAEAMMRRDLFGGITAVRCMGDDVRALAELARGSRLHEIPGPDIYYAALFAGPEFFKDPRLVASTRGATPGKAPWMQAIDEQTDLAAAVTLARGAGASAIKIYANLSGSLVKRIVEEAHRQGIQAWSHGMVFPATPQEVIDAGPDTVSHVGYLAYQAVEQRPSRYEDREKFPIDPGPFTDGNNAIMNALFGQMREKRIILDATNYVFHTIERMRARNPKNAPPPPYCSSHLAELLTSQAHRNGVLISVGTDSFSESSDPYPAVQGEMEILVRKCGMSPMEGIRSATLVSAMSMRQEGEMGTVEPGKLANLIFLSANPLQDIAAMRKVTLTVKRGVRYPRSRYRPITRAEVEGRR
jgi:imidazolonepropionase-like amidohydrolase